MESADDWTRRQLAKFPPLTDEQRVRIVALLTPSNGGSCHDLPKSERALPAGQRGAA